jgi:hypothetical protein
MVNIKSTNNIIIALTSALALIALRATAKRQSISAAKARSAEVPSGRVQRDRALVSASIIIRHGTVNQYFLDGSILGLTG